MISIEIINELAEKDTVFKYNNTVAIGITKKILRDIGLPRSVASYIDFSSEDEGGGQYLSSYFNLSQSGDQYTDKEIKHIKNKFKNYIYLGNLNSGEIIVIDDTEEIVLIDHEDLSESFVNSNLNSFLLCIYEYYKFIKLIKSRFGVDVFIEDVAEINDVEALKEKLLKIDLSISKYEGFWIEELEELIEEIEER